MILATPDEAIYSAGTGCGKGVASVQLENTLKSACTKTMLFALTKQEDYDEIHSGAPSLPEFPFATTDARRVRVQHVGTPSVNQNNDAVRRALLCGTILHE